MLVKSADYDSRLKAVHTLKEPTFALWVGPMMAQMLSKMSYAYARITTILFDLGGLYINEELKVIDRLTTSILGDLRVLPRHHLAPEHFAVPPESICLGHDLLILSVLACHIIDSQAF